MRLPKKPPAPRILRYQLYPKEPDPPTDDDEGVAEEQKDDFDKKEENGESNGIDQNEEQAKEETPERDQADTDVDETLKEVKMEVVSDPDSNEASPEPQADDDSAMDREFPLDPDEDYPLLMTDRTHGLTVNLRMKIIAQLGFFLPCNVTSKKGKRCTCEGFHLKGSFLHTGTTAFMSKRSLDEYFSCVYARQQRLPRTRLLKLMFMQWHAKNAYHYRHDVANEPEYVRKIRPQMLKYVQLHAACHHCGHEMLSHCAPMLLQDDVILVKLYAISRMIERLLIQRSTLYVWEARRRLRQKFQNIWYRRRNIRKEPIPEIENELDLERYAQYDEMIRLLLVRIEKADPDLEFPVPDCGMPPFFDEEECSVEDHLRNYLTRPSSLSTRLRIRACEYVLSWINLWRMPKPSAYVLEYHRQRPRKVYRLFRRIVRSNKTSFKRNYGMAKYLAHYASREKQDRLGKWGWLRNRRRARFFNLETYSEIRAQHFWWCKLPRHVRIQPQFQPVHIFGRHYARLAVRNCAIELLRTALKITSSREFLRGISEVMMYIMKEQFDLPPDVEDEERLVKFEYVKMGRNRQPIKKMFSFYKKWLKSKKNRRSKGDINKAQLIKAAAKWAAQRRMDQRKNAPRTGDLLTIDATRADDMYLDEINGEIQFRVIQNRVDIQMPQNILYYLTQLQQLYSVQLPKMPREYITRLVFDTRHMNLVIIKPDRGIIGGVCCRPFMRQGFSEIVFCAVTADEQVKGYGTHMMNHLKEFHARSLQVYHLMTYADKFAIGYFSKQGFTTQIQLPSECYKGFIKEYEGATLMACHLHPQIPYTHYPQFAHAERNLIRELAKMKFSSNAEEVATRAGIEHLHREYLGEAVPLKVIRDLENEKPEVLPHRRDAETKIRQIINKLRNNEDAWPFLDPVDADEVPEYYSYIQQPIDLRTMSERLRHKYYTHEVLFLADLRRLFDNCYRFNAVDTEYYRLGYVVNKHALELCETSFPDLPDWHPRLPETRPTLYVSDEEGSD